jgi:Right handed beta helix region
VTVKFAQRFVLATTLLLCACGTDDVGGGSEPDPPDGPACAPPNRVVGDACVAPGVQDDGCEAGSMALEDGSCRPAGLVPGDCGEGFVHDGNVGCDAILPPEPCADGLMAVPGETACHPVMDCGTGKWGGIVTDADTQHVDQSFVGTSDGTADAPWTTITEGILAGTPGSLVAIAAGSYSEDILMTGIERRVHGVCPQQVELVGSGGAIAALFISGSGSSGTEVRGISVRGDGAGIVVSGAQDVLLEHLYVHDNAAKGVAVQDDFGPTSCTLRASLIERNQDGGVQVAASEATIEQVLVRDNTVTSEGLFGRGINIIANLDEDPASAIVRNSVVERNHTTGVFVSGSEATIENLVVRDNLPNEAGFFGRGIDITQGIVTGIPSRATVRTSLVEDNHQDGLYVSGSEVSVEATVVRDTQLDINGQFGRGITVVPGVLDEAPSLATVFGCLVEGNHAEGIFVRGSQATIEAVHVVDTQPDAQGLIGRGIALVGNLANGEPSVVTVRACTVERNHDVGLLVVDSDATVDACWIRQSLATPDGLFGDGLLGVTQGSPTNVFVSATRIDDSARAGLSNFGGHVSLGSSAIRCADFNLAGEPFGGADFTFEDAGHNACGCPDADGICKVLSAGLEPPTGTSSQ